MCLSILIFNNLQVLLPNVAQVLKFLDLQIKTMFWHSNCKHLIIAMVCKLHSFTILGEKNIDTCCVSVLRTLGMYVSTLY